MLEHDECKETIQMLKILLEGASASGKRKTVIKDVCLDSFNFVIETAIALLEKGQK